MNDNRNMILAIVLSALVLFGWGYLTQSYFPTANPPATKIENGKRCRSRSRKAGRGAAARRAPTRNRDAVLARDARASQSRPRAWPARSTSRARGSTIWSSPTHARASAATRRRSASSRRPARRDAYYGGFGWSGRGRRRARPRHALAGERRPASTPATPVTLSWDNGQGQIFQICSRSTTAICSPSSRA